MRTGYVGLSQARLGRQTGAFDARNLNFLISDHADVDPTEAVRSQRAALAVSRGGADAVTQASTRRPTQGKYHWDSAWHGDQGFTSMCTAFAALHAMADGPVTHKGRNPLEDPGALYSFIQAIDREMGLDFGPEGGATMLALAKALHRKGWISAYLWGYTVADLVSALQLGPVLIGVDWYEGMDDPQGRRGEKVLRAVGTVRGGHAIVVNGIDLDDGMVRLRNSWGRSWGDGGHGLLPIEDVEWLIADGGEVLTFMENPDAAERAVA